MAALISTDKSYFGFGSVRQVMKISKREQVNNCYSLEGTE
jgi:hypothetical protein